MPNSRPSPGLRQTYRHEPPTCRSISQTGMVQPSGPSSQFGTCAGSVKAANTNRLGALNILVLTISRSDGVVQTEGFVLSSVAIFLLLFLLFEGDEVFVQSLVARIPEPAIAVGPFGHRFQWSRLECRRSALGVPAPNDQAGPFQDAEMLGDRRTTHVERLRQLFDRGLASGQPGQDRPARRIGQRREGDAEPVRWP